MMHIAVVFAGSEYDLEVDGNDGAAVLAFQLYSLLGVDVESQVLVTTTGVTVTLDDTIASITKAAPWLLLVDSSAPSSSFNPAVDSDWRDSCTRVVAPSIPLVQPAYSFNGTPICHSCATTCALSSGSLVTPVSNSTETRDRIRQAFICDLDVVVGAADVPAPLGYTKVNVDLNHTASGPFVFLCYKRGGSHRPISHVKVVRGEGATSPPPEVDGYTTLPVNLNHGTKSATSIYLCFRRLAGDDWRQLSGLALQELDVSSSHESASGFVRSQVDLNEGNVGSTPLFLHYSVNPIAGFICGSHGECLFQPRVAVGGHDGATSSWPQLSAHQLAAAQTMDASLRHAWNAEAARHFEREEAQLKQMLAGQLQNTLKYERSDYQAKALATIPLPLLQDRARANPTPQPTFEDEVLRQLIRWFKHEFFTWMNSPPCRACGADTQNIRQEGPVTPEEIAGEAGRVEVYQCIACRALTRFPRYNDPTKLLQTRTGRCGEWANCFTLCCRALGYEARYVHDFTDHVWTEVFSAHHQRWLHCDPCEDQLDCPLTYEVGWGKKLHYIFATSVDEIVDVARRYTRDFDALLDRRTRAREPQLARILADLNATKAHSAPRKQILATRAAAEERELAAVKQIKAHETVGRISGSKEWRDARDESGNADAVKTAASTATTLTTTTVDANQLLRSLFQSMVQGGCSRSTTCVNSYCLHSHARKPGFDLTAHSAASIQAIAALQHASGEGLASLTCPDDGSFQAMLLALPLAFYWPLQDHASSVVVDASAHRRHGANANCPVHKPFAVKFGPANTGVQLLPSSSPLRSLTTTLGKDLPDGWTLQWLVRWGAAGSKSNSAVSAPFLTLRSASGQVHRLSYTSSLRLVWTAQHDAAAVSSADALAVDTTYHVALVGAGHALTCYVNGKRAFHAPSGAAIHDVEFAIPEATSSLLVPLLSHVALAARALTAEELESLARAAVPSPQLVARGADPVDPSVICREAAALEDSGLRVSAVHMWSGDFFDGVQVMYQDKNGQVAPGHAWTTGGAATAAKQTLQLMEGEFITQVRGRRGAWMDQLSVSTNFGRTLTAGGSGGGPFEVSIPPGHMARAFSFDIGDHVNQPVVFSCPAPQGPVYVALKAAKASLGKAGVELAAQGVVRYLTNLADKPENAAFHKIKASNAYFVKNVAPLGVHVDAVFDACGFGRVQEAGGEVFFVYRHEAAPPHAIRRALYDIATFLAVEK